MEIKKKLLLSVNLESIFRLRLGFGLSAGGPLGIELGLVGLGMVGQRHDIVFPLELCCRFQVLQKGEE